MLRSGEHPGVRVIETRGRGASPDEVGDWSEEVLGWRAEPACRELSRACKYVFTSSNKVRVYAFFRFISMFLYSTGSQLRMSFRKKSQDMIMRIWFNMLGPLY